MDDLTLIYYIICVFFLCFYVGKMAWENVEVSNQIIFPIKLFPIRISCDLIFIIMLKCQNVIFPKFRFNYYICGINSSF